MSISSSRYEMKSVRERANGPGSSVRRPKTWLGVGVGVGVGVRVRVRVVRVRVRG
jgi:hypothetical protein